MKMKWKYIKKMENYRAKKDNEEKDA